MGIKQQLDNVDNKVCGNSFSALYFDYTDTMHNIHVYQVLCPACGCVLTNCCALLAHTHPHNVLHSSMHVQETHR